MRVAIAAVIATSSRSAWTGRRRRSRTASRADEAEPCHRVSRPGRPGRARWPVVPPVSRVSSMNAPSRMEISRSAVAAIRASWVTTTSVCPAACRLSNSRSTSRVASLSRLPVGSSAKHDERRVGERAGDRDPLPLPAGQLRWQDTWPGRPDLTCSAGPLARRRAARGERPASSAGSSTFSTAVSSSIRWKAWNTKPTASRRNRARASLAHLVDPLPGQAQISPADGRSRPPSRCSSVDLPQPLGPITATVSPAATSRSTLSTARTSPAPRPYSLRSPRAHSDGVVHGSPLLPARPGPFAGLQPAQVRLQPEHDALQQQRRPRSGPARPSRRAARPAAGAAARGAGRPRS